MWLRLTASAEFFQRKEMPFASAKYEGCLKDEVQTRYFSLINWSFGKKLLSSRVKRKLPQAPWMAVEDKTQVWCEMLVYCCLQSAGLMSLLLRVVKHKHLACIGRHRTVLVLGCSIACGTVPDLVRRCITSLSWAARYSKKITLTHMRLSTFHKNGFVSPPEWLKLPQCTLILTKHKIPGSSCQVSWLVEEGTPSTLLWSL